MREHPLKKAYEATAYWVEDRFAIRCQERSPALDALLLERGHDSWAYITACNPDSVALDDAENTLRMATLSRRLEAIGHSFLTGQGVGAGQGAGAAQGAEAGSDWPPEPSLLVLGIGTSEAVELGREFGQVAIVIGRRGEPARLCFCAAPSQ